jgi:acetolactate synthase-1/2/3 large subunit
MLSLGRPDIDWVALARGMGVDASLAQTCDQLIKALRSGFQSQGPYLVEVAV